jgi:hypothetical protein
MSHDGFVAEMLFAVRRSVVGLGRASILCAAVLFYFSHISSPETDRSEQARPASPSHAVAQGAAERCLKTAVAARSSRCARSTT